MLRRSVFSALSLGLAILALRPQSFAQEPAQKDSQKPAPAKPVEKSAAKSAEEQVYERAKATLSRYIEEVNAREGDLKQVLGGEYSTDLAATFSDFRKGLKQELTELEARHQEALKVKDEDCPDCSDAYHAAIVSGLRVQESGNTYDPNWLNPAMDVLNDEYRRRKDQLTAELEKRKADLDKNPNLPSEVRDKQLDEFESQQSKKIFDDLARKFRACVRILSEEHKKNIQELWRWFDFAAQLRKSKEDAHATGVRYAEEMLSDYRKRVNEHGKEILPERELYMSYSNYTWWTERPYKDIQEPQEGRHDVFSTALVEQPSVDSLRPPKESVAATADCSELRLTYSPSPIKTGKKSEPALHFLPSGCVPPKDSATFDTPSQKRIPIKLDTETGVAEGWWPGFVTIFVTVGQLRGSANLIVLDRPCTTLTPIFSDEGGWELGFRILGPGQSAVVTEMYGSEEGNNDELCVRPGGRRQLKSDNPGILRTGPASSNLVTGVAPGTTTLHVTHGNLAGSSKVEVASKPYCERLNMSLPDYISVGETVQASVTYEPSGCDPSIQGFYKDADFYADSEPSSIVTVELSGAITGMQPGEIMIAARGGGVSTRKALVVKSICSEAKLNIVPESIIVGETAQANLSFVPEGCTPPKGFSVRYSNKGDSGSVDVGLSGQLTGLNAGKARIRGSRGDLGAEADLTVAAAPACQSFSVDYPDATVAVGKTTEVPKTTFLPPSCQPPDGRLEFSGDQSLRAHVDSSTGRVTGTQPGDITVKAKKGNLETSIYLSVIRMRCEKIDMKYLNPLFKNIPWPEIDVGESSPAPTLEYSPEGCAQPQESPAYHVSPTELADVDPGTGILTGRQEGKVRVTVEHGALPPVETSMNVINACSGVVLTYTKDPDFDNQWSFTPHLSYSPPACRQPYGDRKYSISDSQVAYVITGDHYDAGVVRSRKEGTVTVTVTQTGAALGKGLSTTAVIQIPPTPACASLLFGYTPIFQLHIGEQATPTYSSYTPRGCAKPDGTLEYTSDQPDIVRVDGKTGRITALKKGSAHIRVKHGGLEGHNSIEVN